MERKEQTSLTDTEVREYYDDYVRRQRAMVVSGDNPAHSIKDDGELIVGTNIPIDYNTRTEGAQQK